MSCATLILTACAVLAHLSCVDCSYVVLVTENGPIVRGGTITFQADVFSSDGSRPQGDFQFSWKDDTLDHHSWTDTTKKPTSTWTVTYPADKYHPGEYEVQVNVDKFELVFWMPIGSRRQSFNITRLLNGQMDLLQDNLLRLNFVSNATQVQHEVNLSKGDLAFLENATEIATYWFIDCIYYGETENFSFNYTYGTVGANHSVQALVVASFEPPTTTTTTTTSTTTTTTSTTTTTTTTSTPPPSTTALTSTTSAKPSSSSSNLIFSSMIPMKEVTSLKDSSNENNTSVINKVVDKVSQMPNVCSKLTPQDPIIPQDPNKTYGYYYRQFGVRSPIHNISIKGTNWLLQDKLLDLQVLCAGSGNFTVCSYKENADYNVTGKESCPAGLDETIENCQFNVSHYYSYENYTVVVIIKNDVSNVIYPVKIIIYQVQKHAQLSVIVVPVVCSVVAVVMIVFGVAYYVQQRKRFTVEVADFDFGPVDGDMEYKTFRERLREAVVNSLNRDFGVDGEGNVWSPSRKYGSMQ